MPRKPSNKKAKLIIFDEKGEAEKLLSQPPEKYITYKTMMLICKYYYSLGFDSKKVKKLLIDYCNSSEYFNFTLSEEKLNRAVRKAKLYSLNSFNYRIPITKNEVNKLKVLSHKDYRLALYILFITKLERYQNIKKKNAKAKTFSPYFHYDLRTAYYNMMRNFGNGNQTITKKEALDIFRRLYKAKILKPMINKETIMVLCADFENKGTEFIIDASKPFLEQVKYYCLLCGKETAKSRNHDFCKECYSEKRKNDKLEKNREYRARSAS